MLITFLSSSEYILGATKKTGICQKDIEFDQKKQYPILIGVEGEYDIAIMEEPKKTPQEQREEKLQEFISSTDVSGFDWEGVEITPEDYSRLIILRDFEGDNGAQQAMLAKTDMKHLAMFKAVGVPVATLKAVYAEEIAKLNQISKTRVAIGLNAFDLSFLDE